MIYTEEHDNLKSARAREKYLKSASGRKWMRSNVFEK